MTDDPFATSGALRFGPIVTAEYEGLCTQCDWDIEEGDDIRADGEGGWMHADCGEDQ